MTKAAGKDAVAKLVESFDHNKAIYLAKSFQETENRTHFINPFFEALGWQFNQNDLRRGLWDVRMEVRAKVRKSTRKPDYGFYIDGKLRFYVEAKAPWVKLSDPAPIFQAKSYAFSSNGVAPIVILTDFEEFRVFNALSRPDYDLPLSGLVKDYDLRFEAYLDRWDSLYDAFSKEAVRDGSLSALAGKASRNAKKLDVDFLDSIREWRELLAKNFDHGQDEMFKKAILPDLATNVRRGNSLIDRDQLYANELFGDEDILPFDWGDFGESGFDVIVGNPPYIRIQEMQEWAPKEVERYKRLYASSSAKNYDIYVVFVEKALSLLSMSGRFGFILPNKFMQQEYGESIRTRLALGRHVSRIVNFKDFQVFKGATTYTCLLFLKSEPSNAFEYSECSSEEMNLEFSLIPASRLTSLPWSIHKVEDIEFLDRLAHFPKLEDLCESIFVGIQTSADEVYITDLVEERPETFLFRSKILDREVELEKAHVRHIISGLDVKKYRTPPARQYVLFPYDIADGKPVLVSKKHLEKVEPRTWAYLQENKKLLESRESRKMKGDRWYGYVYLKNMALQNHPKICVPRLVQEIQAIFDVEGAWCHDNVDVGGVVLKPEYHGHEYYFLGLLNSKLLTKYLSKISTPFRGGFWSCNRQYLEQLPIYVPDPTDMDKYPICGKIEETVRKVIELRRNDDERSIKDAVFWESKVD